MTEKATIDPHRLATLTGLSYGAHGSADDDEDALQKVINQQVCIMEAVSYVCNLSWGDSPRCVDDFLMHWGIWYNDQTGISNEQRNKLVPLIPKLVNTKYHNQETKLSQRLRTFDLILERLSLPYLRGMTNGRAGDELLNLKEEIAWFTQLLADTPDTRERIDQLHRHHEHLREYGGVNYNVLDLYEELTTLGDAIVCGETLSFDEDVFGMYQYDVPDFYNIVLGIYSDVLDIRDVASEEAAMQAEVDAQNALFQTQLEHMFGKIPAHV
jgi:hypothetical protein